MNEEVHDALGFIAVLLLAVLFVTCGNYRRTERRLESIEAKLDGDSDRIGETCVCE